MLRWWRAGRGAVQRTAGHMPRQPRGRQWGCCQRSQPVGHCLGGPQTTFKRMEALGIEALADTIAPNQPRGGKPSRYRPPSEAATDRPLDRCKRRSHNQLPRSSKMATRRKARSRSHGSVTYVSLPRLRREVRHEEGNRLGRRDGYCGIEVGRPPLQDRLRRPPRNDPLPFEVAGPHVVECEMSAGYAFLPAAALGRPRGDSPSPLARSVPVSSWAPLIQLAMIWKVTLGDLVQNGFCTGLGRAAPANRAAVS